MIQRQMTLSDLRTVVFNTRSMDEDTPLRIVVDNPTWGRTELYPVQDIKVYQPAENQFYLDFESTIPENE